LGRFEPYLLGTLSFCNNLRIAPSHPRTWNRERGALVNLDVNMAEAKGEALYLALEELF